MTFLHSDPTGCIMLHYSLHIMRQWLRTEKHCIKLVTLTKDDKKSHALNSQNDGECDDESLAVRCLCDQLPFSVFPHCLLISFGLRTNLSVFSNGYRIIATLAGVDRFEDRQSFCRTVMSNQPSRRFWHCSLRQCCLSDRFRKERRRKTYSRKRSTRRGCPTVRPGLLENARRTFLEFCRLQDNIRGRPKRQQVHQAQLTEHVSLKAIPAFRVDSAPHSKWSWPRKSVQARSLLPLGRPRTLRKYISPGSINALDL